MNHEITRKLTLIVPVLYVMFFYHPVLSHASGSLVVGSDRGGYTAVTVGPDRYYYHEGVYYTGGPGNYVAVEAPAGAVVYNLPVGYEEVEVDGVPYLRYRDVYYRHGLRGYEVVHVDRSHVHERGWAKKHQHDHDHGHVQGEHH